MSSHQESPDPTNPQPSANGRTGLLAPKLEMIGEDETMDSYDLYDPYGDDQSERGDMDMDFLEVELVRSESLEKKCLHVMLDASSSSACSSLSHNHPTHLSLLR